MTTCINIFKANKRKTSIPEEGDFPLGSDDYDTQLHKILNNNKNKILWLRKMNK